MKNHDMNHSHKPAAIHWGIIGCGDVTEHKSGPAFHNVPHSSLFGVMRRDGEKASDYAGRHQVQFWTDDASRLIHHPQVNAIYVATPPKYHEEYVVAALEAGKPVYVEKPFSVDVASCLRMQTVADACNKKLTVAHYRRALPKFIQIREWLEQGLVGDIRLVNIQLYQSKLSEQVAKSWRVIPEIAGAGLFYDLAPHQLDLLFYFFGDTVRAIGQAVNQAGLYAAEDQVSGMVEMEHAVFVNGSWCFTTAPEWGRDLFEIIGSSGRISFSVFGHDLAIESGTLNEQLQYTPPQHIQQPMIEQVVGYFRGEHENPCPASEAIKSMRLMESCVYGNK